jgi:hypothetical protein
LLLPCALQLNLNLNQFGSSQAAVPKLEQRGGRAQGSLQVVEGGAMALAQIDDS